MVLREKKKLANNQHQHAHLKKNNNNKKRKQIDSHSLSPTWQPPKHIFLRRNKYPMWE